MRNNSDNNCKVFTNSSFPINGIYYYFIGCMASQIFVFIFKVKHETKKVRWRVTEDSIILGKERERDILVTIKMNQFNDYLNYLPLSLLLHYVQEVYILSRDTLT